jgi:hypothetical protein
MDETEELPKDTREFLAQWNAATEAHLSAKLAALLQQLGGQAPPVITVPMEPYASLAPHVLRALQIAADPGATVHDAIDYLEETAERQ